MEVVLVRHGVGHPRDGGRELSDHGRHQVATLARALDLRGTSPDLVLSSRSDHAQETARLLSRLLAAGKRRSCWTR